VIVMQEEFAKQLTVLEKLAWNEDARKLVESYREVGKVFARIEQILECDGAPLQQVQPQPLRPRVDISSG
jgi:hypothetical protein